METINYIDEFGFLDRWLPRVPESSERSTACWRLCAGSLCAILTTLGAQKFMEYHLDRRLRLLTEPEHKSLYLWAITEVDDAGQVVGRDQIPWVWTLYFTATEIVLGDNLTVKEGGDITGRIQQTEEISERRSIRAKLRSGDVRSDKNWFRQTTYKMFGTDRVISDFHLDVHPLASEDGKESCHAWGMVGYTSDADFRRATEEDYVGFTLMVKPSTFNIYAQRIADGTADEIIFAVGMVSGFYSEWSPDISTRDVKILATGSEQVVELPVGVAFEPPRLGGRVGEAHLYINAKRVQARKHVDEEGEPQEAPLVRPETVQPPAFDGGKEPQVLALLTSLKGTGRWIIGLLILLVLATIWR